MSLSEQKHNILSLNTLQAFKLSVAGANTTWMARLGKNQFKVRYGSKRLKNHFKSSQIFKAILTSEINKCVEAVIAVHRKMIFKGQLLYLPLSNSEVIIAKTADMHGHTLQEVKE